MMAASGKLQIFVTEYSDREPCREEITDDFYWFEENFVHDLNQAYDRFGFETIVDGVTVWKNTAE